MTTFDVRNESHEEITMILFAEEESADSYPHPHSIRSCANEHDKYLAMFDGESECFINSIEHAENLIKALCKAIELGWIK